MERKPPRRSSSWAVTSVRSWLRGLGGAWIPTARSPLRDVSPWPMVVNLPEGSAWDAIGKVFRRLELGDSEYLPAFYAAARATRRG